MRAEVNRVLEQARKDKVIGAGLEAKVTVYANDEIRPLLEQLGNELRFVLITSQAIVKPLTEADIAEGELAGLAVKVENADGEKCPRCWHYATDIGTYAGHEEVCGRCVENVAGSGEKRLFA